MFFDIFILLLVFGIEFIMVKGKGFVIFFFVCIFEDIQNLRMLDDLDQFFFFIRQIFLLLRKEVEGKVILIGFIGILWIFVVYVMEGLFDKNFIKIKSIMMYNFEILYVFLVYFIDVFVIYVCY